MHGANLGDPGRFGNEYWLMREMGWSWQDLTTIPFVVLEEIFLRLSFQKKWEAKKQEMDSNVGNTGAGGRGPK